MYKIYIEIENTETKKKNSGNIEIPGPPIDAKALHYFMITIIEFMKGTMQDGK